jgi:ketosteroid isomerase-like protein
MSHDEMLQRARTYIDASGRGDVDALLGLMAPECRIWHNFDDQEVTREHSVRTVAWLHRTVKDLAWEEVALLITDTGWVSQSIITGIAPGGPIRAHTCVVTTVDDAGQVVRIAEYLDPSQLTALRA